ncbi:hypothetical protein PENSUB_13642 [Penicillium subrubescens]|jgi:hypothetical protein|uniref:Uncharacterized protein n=1 Tax=Penicillium subrubescens TaxID=1316194 RepID=A0A1Q5SNS3_9EURO|nr:hypothetical protein PENSUB_13642 [Penicillium subrubescens]
MGEPRRIGDTWAMDGPTRPDFNIPEVNGQWATFSKSSLCGASPQTPVVGKGEEE